LSTAIGKPLQSISMLIYSFVRFKKKDSLQYVDGEHFDAGIIFIPLVIENKE
jgi:hypothetical protein